MFVMLYIGTLGRPMCHFWMAIFA